MKKLALVLFSWMMLLVAHAQNTVAIEAFAKDTVTEKALPLKKETVSPSEKKVIKDLYELDNLNTVGPRLNPRAVSFVKDYMEDYGPSMEKMKDWGRPYFNMMDGILVSHNLPKELKYLAVIESKLKTTAVSWAGAVGPWQFMPATARNMGLVVNRKVDERTNYIKSTHAAAKYLNVLYKEFGDWLLVIAAYNGGPGNVYKAIRKSGSRNFWDLQYHLPAESRNHVKKFIGTHYIFEGQGGLTTLTKQETASQYGINLYTANRKITSEELTQAKTQKVSGKYNSLVIAKYLIMDINEFNRYNPDFDKVMASTENTYEMKLPADKMELFNANKYQILQECIQLLLNNTVAGNAAENNANYGNTEAVIKKIAKK